MAHKVSEDIMIRRRLERLRHLNFFMQDERVPPKAKRVFSLSAAHNLMTGFFENSYWRLAWWCLWKAAQNSRQNLTISIQFLWWRKVLRLTSEQIDDRIEKDALKGV